MSWRHLSVTSKFRKTQLKAVAARDEKIQQRSRRRGRLSSSHFIAGKCPNLGRDSISCCRKIGNAFPAASTFARKPFQQGISDSHNLLKFSKKCVCVSMCHPKGNWIQASFVANARPKLQVSALSITISKLGEEQKAKKKALWRFSCGWVGAEIFDFSDGAGP